MDVFLTGGTGIIGSAILRRLLIEGKSVAALARSKASADRLAQAGAKPVMGDLATPEAWIDTALGCRGIIHTGASFGPDMAGEERRLVALLRRKVPELTEPPRLVYTGGVWVYPASPRQALTESSAFDPLPAFSHLGELTRSLLTIPRMGVAIIHPALVSAPGRGPLAEMAEAAVMGEPFVTRASPETVWPLVDADDLADLYLRALASSQFRLSLIGSGLGGASLAEIAETVSAVSGAPVSIETAPAPDGDPRHDIAAGYARSQNASSARAMRMLGWRPVFTTLEALVTVAVGPLPTLAAPTRRDAAPAEAREVQVEAAASSVGSKAEDVSQDLSTETAPASTAEAMRPVLRPDPAALAEVNTDAQADDWSDDWAEDELPPLPLRARSVVADVEAGGPFSSTPALDDASGDQGGQPAEAGLTGAAAADQDPAPLPEFLREPDPEYAEAIEADDGGEANTDMPDQTETKP